MTMVTLLVTGTLALAQADAANDTELRDQVRKLVRGLSAGSLEVRNNAEHELLDLGVPALAHLPEVRDNMPLEVRKRLLRVRDKLEKIQAVATTKSRRLTLQVDGRPLSEVLNLLEQQSGNRIVDHPIFRAEPKTDPPITVDLVDVTFWRALDTVLERAKLTTYPFAIDEEGKPIRAVAIASPTPDLPGGSRGARTCYEGPFRFEPIEVVTRRGLRGASSGTLQIDVEASWEPRLIPIKMDLVADTLIATDDKNRTLHAIVEGRRRIQMKSQTAAYPLLLELPARDANQLQTVKGSVEALIPGQTETFRFDKLVGAKHVKQKKAGATVMLDSVRKNRSVWEIRVIVRFESSAGALESHLMDWVMENETYLESKDGKKIKWDTQEKTRELDDEFGVAYLFGFDGDLDGYTFVYKTPAALVSQKIPFEFKNLPLP
ncbi:MAG: hypothetical protein VX988_10760 [Planctomycetota bacterium]|nr:hypothetical protein [Planctomycetota bacterium]